MLWGFISLVLEPWVVWSGLGLGWLSPKISTTGECGTAHSTAAATLRHTMSPPFSFCLCISAPPPCLDECGFFKSLVDGLLYSSIFWQLSVLFVLRFICNSLCVCERRRSISIYASILTRSLTFLGFFWMDFK